MLYTGEWCSPANSIGDVAESRPKTDPNSHWCATCRGLKIGAFNVQILGQTKIANTEVVDILVEVRTTAASYKSYKTFAHMHDDFLYKTLCKCMDTQEAVLINKCTLLYCIMLNT